MALRKSEALLVNLECVECRRVRPVKISSAIRPEFTNVCNLCAHGKGSYHSDVEVKCPACKQMRAMRFTTWIRHGRKKEYLCRACSQYGTRGNKVYTSGRKLKAVTCSHFGSDISPVLSKGWPKMLDCLGPCGKKRKSTGPGDRICDSCKRKQEGVFSEENCTGTHANHAYGPIW